MPGTELSRTRCLAFTLVLCANSSPLQKDMKISNIKVYAERFFFLMISAGEDDVSSEENSDVDAVEEALLVNEHA